MLNTPTPSASEIVFDGLYFLVDTKGNILTMGTHEYIMNTAHQVMDNIAYIKSMHQQMLKEQKAYQGNS